MSHVSARQSRRLQDTHRLDRCAELAARIEQLELLQVNSQVVVDQVGIPAKQPRVVYCRRCRQTPSWVHGEELADQVLQHGAAQRRRSNVREER